MTARQTLISRIASHGLTGLGMALIAGAALLAQAQAEAATPGQSSMTAQATEAVAISAASVSGAFRGPGLSIREIAERMEAQGYRHLSDIEWEDGLYQVDGQTAEGRAVKLYVDGHNGKVLSVRTRH